MTTERHYKCDNGINFNAYYADLQKSEIAGVEMSTCMCDYCDFKTDCEEVF